MKPTPRKAMRLYRLMIYLWTLLMMGLPTTIKADKVTHALSLDNINIFPTEQSNISTTEPQEAAPAEDGVCDVAAMTISEIEEREKQLVKRMTSDTFKSLFLNNLNDSDANNRHKIIATRNDEEVTEEKLEILSYEVSNEDSRTSIAFKLESSNTPVTIYSVEWENYGTLMQPLEPFTLVVKPEDVAGQKIELDITLYFPFTSRFGDADMLIVHTDRGTIKCPTSTAGRFARKINILVNDYETQLDASSRSTQRAWIILALALIIVIIIACIAFVTVRRNILKKRREIEELSLLITERTDRNLELEAKVDKLYGSRLDTLNMLCNEYFEKNESEKVKLSLYNEVERHILALRDSKSIAELEMLVNTYLDNILIRVKEQLPELNKNDLTFLTYLYAGFSPRAVCIFTDIKIKNFYNRRSRLKERILASEAPDREFFVSKMQL